LSGSHTATNSNASQEPTATTVIRARYLLLSEAAVGGILLVRTFHFCSILRDRNLLKIKNKAGGALHSKQKHVKNKMDSNELM
jgi:hypothetical protein